MSGRKKSQRIMLATLEAEHRERNKRGLHSAIDGQRTRRTWQDGEGGNKKADAEPVV